MFDEVKLHDLSFSYEEGKHILQNLTLTLEKNKSYVLIGESGCGKSTLLQLLQHYYDNYSGKIEIDGIELREIDKNSLFQIIATIQQDIFIFDDTIRNNITLFKEYSEEELNHAIRLSDLEQVVEKRTLDYLCGAGGSNLSGGECQRIAIARCMLMKKPILLLDEITSALDYKTAMEIEKNILKLENTTKIVITHKISPEILPLYDEIIVLREGKVSLKGSYQDIKEEINFYGEFLEQENEADPMEQ